MQFLFMSVFTPNTHTNAHTLKGIQGQNKRFGVLTQILKAQLLDLPGLPTLISVFPHLCLLPSASTSLPLSTSSIPPYHLSSHLILFVSPSVSLS